MVCRRSTRWPLYVLGHLCLSRSMALPRWARGCAAIAYAFSGPLPAPPQQGVVLPPDRRYRARYPDLLAERSSLPRFAPERGLEDLSLTFPSFLAAKICPGIDRNGWRLSCLILIPWHFIVSLSVGAICACPDQRRFLAWPEVVPRSLTLFLDLSRLHQQGAVLPLDRRYRTRYPDLLAEDLSLTFLSFFAAKIRPGIEGKGWRLICPIPWHFIVSLSVRDVCLSRSPLPPWARGRAAIASFYLLSIPALVQIGITRDPPCFCRVHFPLHLP